LYNMDNINIFFKAINSKKLINLTFNSKEKWIIIRKCVPFDFWPWRRKIALNPDRFHFYDLDSPDWKHNLSILPEEVIKIEILNESFNPWDYVKWQPNWFIKRDWGIYS
jgi:hypothetical protein